MANGLIRKIGKVRYDATGVPMMAYGWDIEDARLVHSEGPPTLAGYTLEELAAIVRAADEMAEALLEEAAEKSDE